MNLEEKQDTKTDEELHQLLKELAGKSKNAEEFIKRVATNWWGVYPYAVKLLEIKEDDKDDTLKKLKTFYAKNKKLYKEEKKEEYKKQDIEWNKLKSQLLFEKMYSNITFQMIESKIKDLSIKQNVDYDYLMEQFNKGFLIEKEHEHIFKEQGKTGEDLFWAIANIVIDHLSEFSNYYEKLKEMENELNTKTNLFFENEKKYETEISVIYEKLIDLLNKKIKENNTDIQDFNDLTNSVYLIYRKYIQDTNSRLFLNKKDFAIISCYDYATIRQSYNYLYTEQSLRIVSFLNFNEDFKNKFKKYVLGNIRYEHYKTGIYDKLISNARLNDILKNANLESLQNSIFITGNKTLPYKKGWNLEKTKRLKFLYEKFDNREGSISYNVNLDKLTLEEQQEMYLLEHEYLDTSEDLFTQKEYELFDGIADNPYGGITDYSLISDYNNHTDLIKISLQSGNYKKYISDGKISVERAIEIIQSAKLIVPNEILELKKTEEEMESKLDLIYNNPIDKNKDMTTMIREPKEVQGEYEYKIGDKVVKLPENLLSEYTPSEIRQNITVGTITDFIMGKNNTPYIFKVKIDNKIKKEFWGKDEISLADKWIEKSKLGITNIQELDKDIQLVKNKLVNDMQKKEEKTVSKPQIEIIKPEKATTKPKTQKSINERILELYQSKGTNRYAYSEEELQLITQYTGKSETKGELGELWDYYTPDQVVQICWGLAYKYGFVPTENKSILEPSAGIGRFLRYAPFNVVSEIVAYEIDKTTSDLLKLIYPNVYVRNTSFSDHFYIKRINQFVAKNIYEKFDLVIGNPPYTSIDTGLLNIIQEKTEKTRLSPNIRTLDQYFIAAGLSALKTNGLLIYVIPHTFMDNKLMYNDFKIYLNKVAEMVDAYRLPNKTFTDTEICTDIIVLRKK